MHQLGTDRLNRVILGFAVGMMLVIGLAVAAASILPLYSILRTQANESVTHALALRSQAVAGYLNHARAVAAQVTSRSVIRDRLIAYNEGRIGLDDLQSFTSDRLADALQLSEHVGGIQRLDAKGRPVVQVGMALPAKVLALAPVSPEIQLAGPVATDEGRWLIVTAPIRARDGRVQGADVLLFSLAPLDRLMAEGVGDTGDSLLLRKDGGLWRSLGSAQPRHGLPELVAAGPLGQVLTEAKGSPVQVSLPGLPDAVWAARPVPGTDWVLAMRQPTAELHGPVDAVVLTVCAVALLLSCAGAVGLLLTLRPLAGHILVREQDMEAKLAELERVRAELTERTQSLQASNAELEQFAYVASHDLKAPLRSVAGFAQLLERRYQEQMDQDGRDYIGFIVDGAKRMDAQISDLLHYSRVDRGERKAERVDLNDVLDAVQADLSARLGETGAVIHRDSLPTVWGEPGLLQRLFQNLLDNALKFAKPGITPEVSVRARPDGGFWIITVRDNGIGFDTADGTRLFRMFSRLHPNDGRYPGTGIGLAICRKIVHRQGGRIWVDAHPGQGAAFHVSLPAGPHSAQPAEAEKTVTPPAAADASRQEA